MKKPFLLLLSVLVIQSCSDSGAGADGGASFEDAFPATLIDTGMLVPADASPGTDTSVSDGPAGSRDAETGSDGGQIDSGGNRDASPAADATPARDATAPARDATAAPDASAADAAADATAADASGSSDAMSSSDASDTDAGVARCSMLNQDCPVGDGCYPLRVSPGVFEGRCYPAGNLAPGSTCNFANDCRRGDVCVSVCRSLCGYPPGGAPLCQSGLTCEDLGIPSLGYCVP